MSMARRKFSVGRALEVLSSGRSSFKGRDEAVLVRVHVDPECPRELALAAKGALLAERAGGLVEVFGLDEPPVSDAAPDAVVVVSGGSDCDSLVSSYARAGVPVGVLVEGALDAPRLSLPDQAAALVRVIAASDARTLADKLASWLVGAVGKPLALAANFPFCRPAVADLLVTRCAAENAVVGAVSLIPGSDLPIMTANQAKLALEMAAAYGRDVDLSRALELAGVVGAGLAYRSAARALLGLVPGAGLLVRAGMGYGGTLATGAALRLRLEGEGPLGTPSSRRDAARARDAAVPGSQALPVADGSDGYVTIGEARS